MTCVALTTMDHVGKISRTASTGNEYQRWAPLAAVVLWLTLIGWAIWHCVQASGQPIAFDAISYWLKARNVWASLAQGDWVNPLDVEPTSRPPGTVLMSYPFGFETRRTDFCFGLCFSASS